MSREKGEERVPFRSHRILFLSVGTLRSDDATVTRTSKTTIDLVSKKTTLHVHLTFFVHFFAVLHDYDVKWVSVKRGPDTCGWRMRMGKCG